MVNISGTAIRMFACDTQFPSNKYDFRAVGYQNVFHTAYVVVSSGIFELQLLPLRWNPHMKSMCVLLECFAAFQLCLDCSKPTNQPNERIYFQWAEIKLTDNLNTRRWDNVQQTLSMVVDVLFVKKSIVNVW